jgi:hypothetical protein
MPKKSLKEVLAERYLNLKEERALQEIREELVL